jgi:DNA replication protein DnaC
LWNRRSGSMAKEDCIICGGTGWVVSEKEGISAADRCTCGTRSAGGNRGTGADDPRKLPTRLVRDFSSALPPDNPTAQRGLADVMLAVVAYTRNYPKNCKPGLLLIGPPGTGKTHPAIAAVRLLIERGHETRGHILRYQNLLERIRSGYNETLGTSNRGPAA